MAKTETKTETIASLSPSSTARLVHEVAKSETIASLARYARARTRDAR